MNQRYASPLVGIFNASKPAPMIAPQKNSCSINIFFIHKNRLIEVISEPISLQVEDNDSITTSKPIYLYLV